jgi:hypothetical protein
MRRIARANKAMIKDFEYAGFFEAAVKIAVRGIIKMKKQRMTTMKMKKQEEDDDNEEVGTKS